MSYHILVVDDDEFQCKTIQLSIQKTMNYKVSVVHSGREALELLLKPKGNEIDMVILDMSMPEIDGMKVLEKIVPHRPDLPIIINTAYSDIKKAVEAVKMGAVDFIDKQDGPERLKVSIENARMLSGMNKEIKKLNKYNKNQYDFGEIIGRSGALKRTVNFAKKAAMSNIPVLIHGESGVGKELFARAIHGASSRSDKPFIAVNCSAIPENLVESILFGHEKGAFTGAVESSLGKFREANGGTIFLDEIGELPIETQSKLLRVLQNFEVEPVGSGKSFDVNVRIISATNKNLEDQVKEGNFREDLFYRINVFNLEVPALRERKEDIADLLKYFVEKICMKEDLRILEIDSNLDSFLQQYWWPGNIRQLENSIYKAVIMSDNGILGVEDFETIISKINGDEKGTSKKPEASQPEYLNGEEGRFKTMNEYEKDILSRALEFYSWNITKVSKILNLGRSTLYRKMKEYDLEIEGAIEEMDEFRKNKK